MPETLKEIRDRVHKDLAKQKAMKDLAITNIYNVLSKKQDDTVYISWKQLQTISIGENVEMSKDGDVVFIKLSEDENEMVFNTMMYQGGKFTAHFHDCVEICKILKGKMLETRKGDRLTMKVYTEGERAIYDKGELHAMYVDEYTVLEVRFLKKL